MQLSRILAAVIATAVLTGCAPTHLTLPEAKFSFVTIGDTRADEPIVMPKAYRDSIRQINRMSHRPAFVVDVGDLILGYTNDRGLILKEWEAFDRVTSGIKAPVHLVPGNHDIWNEESHAIFTERYGPTHYSFDYGNSHFIVLSSEEWDSGNPGVIAGSQLEWLARDLDAHADATHTFVFLHQPFWTERRESNKNHWDQNVHPLLVKHDVDIVFAGHDHHYVNYGVRDGVQYYVTGGGGAGLDGTREVGGFHHFMVTTVNGDSVGSVVVETDGTVLADTVVKSLQPQVPRQAKVVRVARRPVIDGRISDGEYGSAEPNGGFAQIRGLGYPC